VSHIDVLSHVVKVMKVKKGVCFSELICVVYVKKLSYRLYRIDGEVSINKNDVLMMCCESPPVSGERGQSFSRLGCDVSLCLCLSFKSPS